MRINFVTPLPPLRTDIANHAAALARVLAARCELVLWTDQESWAPQAGIEIRRYWPDAPPWAELNRADATFLNMGNNGPFHHGPYILSRRLPAIVILHDLNLQDFFLHIAHERPGGAAEYVAAMRRCHGEEGEEAARRHLEGALDAAICKARFPLTLGAAERALALVLHNAAAADELARSTRLPVHCLPLSLDLAHVAPRRAPLRRAPPWRLVVFGFLGANRCLPEVLRALAGSPLREMFELDIYGQVWNPEETDALIAALGLADRVRRHGFIERDALERGLEAADLAINLRFPSVGEASASQLMIWAKGLPAIVTRIGWYAQLPGDTVFFVEPGDEVRGVQAHLESFARDRAPYDAAGLRGQRLAVERHGMEGYAEGLLGIAAQAPALHARRAALDLARSAAVRLGGMAGRAAFPGDAVASIASAVAALTRVPA